MFNRVGVAIGALIAVALTVGGVRTSTQVPQESSALLTEIRLMRRSIDALAANQIRVQLLLGRLQMQQVPTARAAAMLQLTRSQLASFHARYEDMQDRVSQLEAMANDAGRTAEDVQNLQREAGRVKGEAARLENQRSSLLAAEAEATRQHAEEQTRLDTLNAKLEEIERTLLPPRKP